MRDLRGEVVRRRPAACGLRAGWGAAELASTRGTETGSNADAASISWLSVKRKELILL
jgi:hypothetical protein